MFHRVLFAFAAFAALLTAQTRPPVVFVRGYDFNSLLTGSCSASAVSDTFGTLPNDLTSQGLQVLWFDQCAEAGLQTVAIENLGQLFGQFLTKNNVTQVDVVSHSMGGLILRAYLAGMQPLTPPAIVRAFNPPLDPRVRRAIFISTPHFGFEPIATGGTDAQVTEMRQGSSFLYDLARWNQGTDDLRGVDSIAIIGNSGTTLAPPAGNTDGIVSTNSASLISFGTAPSRTRVLPYCHTGILALLGLCTGTGIATSDETTTIVRSFLAGTADWQGTGTTFKGLDGGVMLTARDAADKPLAVTKVVYNTAGDTLTPGASVLFKNFLVPANYTMNAQDAPSPLQGAVGITAGAFNPVLLKAPPLIGAIIPSAGLVDARVAAPGQLISLYGAGLASTTAQTPTLFPLPTKLADTTITAGTTDLPLLVVSAGQVNAYLPPTYPTGLTTVTLKTSAGQHSTPLMVVPAAFTFFTANSSGTGPGIAQHGFDNSLITDAAPAKPGEIIVIYGTGLGGTHPLTGLDYANVIPIVTIGGAQAEVSFAGRTPGFVGLDQLNVKVPLTATAGALSVSATSAGRTSNTVTIPVRP